MGKSLKNLHNRGNGSFENENGGANAQNAGINQTQDIKTAEARMGKYRGMDENHLMNELMSKMNNAKDSGSFDTQELETFYLQMAPYLTNEQRNKMRSLINMMKNG